MSGNSTKQKVVVVGAGPVGALAALYAANRGDDVHVYELRGGMYAHVSIDPFATPMTYYLSLFIYTGSRRTYFPIPISYKVKNFF